jgi:hypothetical protein
LNELEKSIKQSVSIKISSTLNNYDTNISLLAVSNISTPFPSQHINVKELKLPPNISLANLNFYKTTDIDTLTGPEVLFIKSDI